MIRFLKDLYLTGFAITFLLSRAKKLSYKTGGGTTILSMIEWFVLLGAAGYFEIIINRRLLFGFSRFFVLATFFALWSANDYILRIRGHGIKFANEFDSLTKSRRNLLVVSWAIVVLVAIGFFICSATAHRHFIRVGNQ